MDETRACLHCYRLDGKGGGVTCDLPSAMAEREAPVWIHLNGHHVDTKKFLREDAGIDPLLIKSMLAEETRPRLEETEQSTLLILRGINHNPGPEPEDLVSIRLWMSGHRIITISRRKARAIADLDERLKQNRGPRKTGEFISMLCMCLNDGIEPALGALEDSIDTLEDISVDRPTPTLRGDLAGVRKQATLFRRHLTPLRDVVSRLQKTDQVWLSPGDKWSLHDSLDRMTRFIEELESLRERSLILQDEIYSALSARLNRNIYLLSVITVIFMPLTFLSGLLGMNVEGIPGASHPQAFAAVCAMAGAIALIQLYIFRRLKWF
ncbi:MAG: zinc transporter ZntB [Alphaproteobacteria bacterium]|nr:zinc transporter ZntB [Alphaproteobacteria bacterium]